MNTVWTVLDTYLGSIAAIVSPEVASTFSLLMKRPVGSVILTPFGAVSLTQGPAIMLLKIGANKQKGGVRKWNSVVELTDKSTNRHGLGLRYMDPVLPLNEQTSIEPRSSTTSCPDRRLVLFQINCRKDGLRNSCVMEVLDTIRASLEKIVIPGIDPATSRDLAAIASPPPICPTNPSQASLPRPAETQRT